jgi:hypothetical protein
MPKWIQIDGELIEVTPDHKAPKRHSAHVIPDLPDYESPVSGLVVHGRKGRRNDLKRHGSRPWEGMEQERKESARQRAYQEQKSNAKLEEAARRAFYELHPDKRRILEQR